ncbi:dephospho-CoA kinase [candidate division KSB1 bacterium]|nr:dephospho-CoA kinase [candidate division KSB1 bacterium]
MAKTVIGLTGSPGSGKSKVARLLQEKGVECIDVDQAGRWAVNENPRVHSRLQRIFGDEYFSQGRLDRRRLGNLIFADAQARARLNTVVHPVMLRRVKQLVAEAKKSSRPSPYIVIDAALLLELKIDRLCDLVVTVTAPEAIRLQRTCERDGVSHQDAVNRMQAQLANEIKIESADYVLDNSGSLNVLAERVESLHRWILDKISASDDL